VTKRLVLTPPDTRTELWCIQSNLGVAWRSMPVDDPQANLEQALATFSAALAV
jgi:hypothetical protein